MFLYTLNTMIYSEITVSQNFPSKLPFATALLLVLLIKAIYSPGDNDKTAFKIPLEKQSK